MEAQNLPNPVVLVIEDDEGDAPLVVNEQDPPPVMMELAPAAPVEAPAAPAGHGIVAPLPWYTRAWEFCAGLAQQAEVLVEAVPRVLDIVATDGFASTLVVTTMAVVAYSIDRYQGGRPLVTYTELRTGAANVARKAKRVTTDSRAMTRAASIAVIGATTLYLGYNHYWLTPKEAYGGLTRRDHYELVKYRANGLFADSPRANELVVESDEYTRIDLHLGELNREGLADDRTRVNPGTPQSRFVAYIAQEVKGQFGCPPRTAENVLAVRDAVRRAMLVKGHRPSHVARDAPLAVELVFVPSQSELEAARFTRSFAVKQREAVYDAVRPTYKA